MCMGKGKRLGKWVCKSNEREEKQREKEVTNCTLTTIEIFFISILYFFPMSTVENKRIVKYLVAGLDFTLMQNFPTIFFSFHFLLVFFGFIKVN